MSDSLAPVTVKGLAQQWGLQPHEILRLLIVHRVSIDALLFEPHQAEKLGSLAGLLDLRESPDIDPASIERREWTVNAIRYMLEHAMVTPKTLRLDNLWRLLPMESARIVQGIVDALAGENLVSVGRDYNGATLSIDPQGIEILRAFVHDGVVPESLAYLWKA